MATRTVINCLETTPGSLASSAKPGISITVDPSQQPVVQSVSSSTSASYNVIKIQHSCQESQTSMTPNTNNNNNNKTLIDINCNNKPNDLTKIDNDSQELKSLSLSLATTSSSTSSSPSPAALASSSSLFNVFKVKCSPNTEANNSQEIKDKENLEPHYHRTNGSILANGNNQSSTPNNNKDHNGHDDHSKQEKEMKTLVVSGKQELNKLPKESGQTAKIMSTNSCSSLNSTTTSTNTSVTTTTTTFTPSQQVIANSKRRENNGHFCSQQTDNFRDALNANNDHHHHNEVQHNANDHHNGHDDVKPAALKCNGISGQRVKSHGALLNHDNHDGNDDDNDVDDGNAKDCGGKHSLAYGNANSLLTKADTATTQLRSQLTINEKSLLPQNGNKENCCLNEESQAHVVKIQINQKKSTEKQISIVKIENQENLKKFKISEPQLSSKSMVDKKSDPKEFNTVNTQSEVNLQGHKEMVQKPLSATGHHATAVSVSGSNPKLIQAISTLTATTTSSTTTTGPTTASHTASGSTTVTDLNVSNPNYLYYMMSSGQFSPCDTLDSGTGSDLETQQHSSQSPIHNHPMLMKKSSNGLEMHLKTTKIRVSNSAKDQRNSSFTDSEESEASSLSCDSLHSNEFIRQSSSSPVQQMKIPSPSSKILGSYLPDSLLRDIKNLKLSNTEYEAENENDNDEEEESKKQRTKALKSLAAYETINTQDYVQTRNNLNSTNTNNSNSTTNNGNTYSFGSLSASLKRSSLPSKTFVLNQEDGTFIDTKMNSMPRKYEADKYYNFHVNEHDNFRSFGQNSNMGMGMGFSGDASDGSDSLSISEYDARSLQDDVFAGYKDIRCGSNTSTIRSSKGTVRGVKNRVRNGIATFLQLQQPNVKNYKEKDSGKVVLYTTSMGIIRDTYAKCSNVKQILRTLLIKFEERDVFMSVEYQQEIKERMHSEIIKVPQLFVEGQHIGDADTVERLNESGELRQLLKPYKSISTTYTCQTCGGYRLLPCPSCNGSKKSVHRNHFTAEFVALKCMNCDEVGLVKCHNC